MSIIGKHRRRVVAPSGYGTDFVTEWETTSASESITLPLRSGYVHNFSVDWGDNSSDQITSDSDPAKTHVYATAGIYEVKISGECGAWYFNNGGDRLKILRVLNWGDVSMVAGDRAFYGCANLYELADDAGISWLNALSGGTEMFRNTTSLQSLPSGMTLDALTSGNEMFRGTGLQSIPSGMTLDALVYAYAMFAESALASLPSGMTLDALFNGFFMFRSTDLTSLPSSMTLAALSNGEEMFNLTNLTDYSDLLVAMEANNPNTNVTFHAGNATYNPTGATARAALVDRGWTFTDGGPA